MPARTSVLALALALALPAAGCLEPVERFFSDDEVSDDEVRDEADAAARAWKADAAFAGAFAFEAREGPYGLDERAPQDPDVGNGEAVAWAFTYLAGGRMGTFVVNATGATVMSDDSEAPDEEFAAVGEQKVDSDEAMATARDDERVEAAVGKAKAVGIALGNNGTSGSVWTVFTIGGSPDVVAIVDAVSGDLRRVESFTMPSFGDWGDWSGLGSWGEGGDGPSMGGEELLFEDSRSGQVTAARPTHEEFDVPEGATRIVLRASGSSVVLEPDLEMTLSDPNGAEVPATGDEEDGLEYVPQGPGTYTVALSPAQGSTTVSYELEIEVWGYG